MRSLKRKIKVEIRNKIYNKIYSRTIIEKIYNIIADDVRFKIFENLRYEITKK